MIYLAADHRGFRLKEEIKKMLERDIYDYRDLGAFEYNKDGDYPTISIKLAKAVVKAHHRGVAIKVYLDSQDISNEHSKSRFLINEGIEDIRISSGYSNHNKFAIIDNRIVITGSYNWTASAGARNDENLLVIDDTYIVQRYHDYFYYLWDNKYSAKRYEELLRHRGIRLHGT